MTTILTVDGRASEREFLATVFSFAGYQVLQAVDGAQALAMTRTLRPDLVITDVAIPVMDGAELADRMHDEPAIADTPIIFYTATEGISSARVLAKSCRAAAVLDKASDPEEILAVVETALGRVSDIVLPPAAVAVPGLLGARLPAYLRDLTGLQRCLRGMLDKAAEQADARRVAASDSDALEYSFQSLSLRLATLLELDIALAAERNPQGMLSLFCRAARGILGCSHAVMGMMEAGGTHLKELAACGLDARTLEDLGAMEPTSGVLGAVLDSGKPYRSVDGPVRLDLVQLPASHPPINSLLVVPIPARTSTSQTGWVYFAGKLDGKPFNEEDEKFAVTLAGQLAFGNLVLYEEVRQHAAELEVEVNERRSAQAELAHRATHDQTTGLPRFVSIEEHLRGAIVHAAATAGRVILLYVDIDRFHVVNETRGRAIGDDVLRVVAARLVGLCGGNGYVAHVAADEFVVVLVDEEGAQDQTEFAEAVRGDIERIVHLVQQRIFLTCSIGVSCFPDNGSSPQELLRQSEAAMLRAKRDGRNTISAFSNEQKQALEDRATLGLRLSDAVRNNELVLHYQPQVRASDGRVVGFEALVRWQSPDFGLLPPMRFLSVAEDLGLIVDVGNFVLDAVCREARAWLDQGQPDFFISINVSSLQLELPDFVDTIRAALARSGVPPCYLELELTESMMVRNVERAIATMKTLNALGVQLALDDFGTGYSSLGYLRRFPIDKLKIDQSFVRDLSSDMGSAGICRAIISLGHELGMIVLAEGVETEAQAAYLSHNGCDQFQGFHFSKPVAASQAYALLQQRDLQQEESPVETSPKIAAAMAG
jgi:diguanylate cyclase (GGDEF)-like protein